MKKSYLLCIIVLNSFLIFALAEGFTTAVYAGSVCGLNFYKCIDPHDTAPDNKRLNIIDLPYNMSLKDIEDNLESISPNLTVSKTAGTECTSINDSKTGAQKWTCCQYEVKMDIKLYGECKTVCTGNNC